MPRNEQYCKSLYEPLILPWSYMSDIRPGGKECRKKCMYWQLYPILITLNINIRSSYSQDMDACQGLATGQPLEKSIGFHPKRC